MPLFGPSFNGTKLKVLLKLCITRLQMLQKKKDNQGVLARKEIASLLGKNKEELARIRVEQIIRDDYIVEVLEILELYCSLLTSRFGLVEAMKECDPGLLESVQTLMWVAPRLQAEIKELREIAQSFGLRYGKDFIKCAMNNEELQAVADEHGKVHMQSAGPGSGLVSKRVMHKLTDYSPKPSLVDNYLVAIAQTYNVDFIPPIRPPEADLLGGAANPLATAPALISNFPSAPLGAASGGRLSDFPGGSDFPPAAGYHGNGGGGGGGGSGAVYLTGGGGGGAAADVDNFSNLFPSPPGGGSGGIYPPPTGGGTAALYPPPQGGGGPDLSFLGGGVPSVDHHEPQPPGREEFEAPPSFDESVRPSNGGGGGGVAPAVGGTSVGAKEREAYGGDVTGYEGATEPMYAEVDAPRVAENETYTPGGPVYDAAPTASFGGGGGLDLPSVPGGGGAGGDDAPPDFDELARRFQNLRERSGE